MNQDIENLLRILKDTYAEQDQAIEERGAMQREYERVKRNMEELEKKWRGQCATATHSFEVYLQKFSF